MHTGDVRLMCWREIVVALGKEDVVALGDDEEEDEDAI